MLELSRLLIEPLGPDGVRGIVDGDSGGRVGFATWRPSRYSWWWPGSPTLSVHEQLDAPVVFTVHRRWNWPPRREVRDAEGNSVGELIGDWVRDQTSRRVATRVRREGHAAAFLDAEGTPLASYWVDGDGMHFDFAPEVAGEPFLKMVLLAAALINGR